MKEMKTLLLDQTRYEIVDAKSREDILTLNENLNKTNQNLRDVNAGLASTNQEVTVLRTDLTTDINNARGYFETELGKKQPLGNYLTEETDPTVPSWAKQKNKPTYTAVEVGADVEGTADSLVTAHNTSTISHKDLRDTVRELNNRVDIIYIPEELPNPNKLIFQGAVTGEYDGSEEVKITFDEHLLVDKTLTIDGNAADAKTVGEKLGEYYDILDLYRQEIEDLKEEINNLKAYHTSAE